MTTTQRCSRCSKPLTQAELEVFNRVTSGFLTMDQVEQMLNVVAEDHKFWSAEGAICPPCLAHTMAAAV